MVLTMRKPSPAKKKPTKKLAHAHAILHIVLALIVSVMLGALVGRAYVAVSKTYVFKQTRSDIVSFVTGRPRFDYKKHQRLMSDSSRAQLFGSN